MESWTCPSQSRSQSHAAFSNPQTDAGAFSAWLPSPEKRLERNCLFAFSVFFHLVFLVRGEGAAVDHVVEGEVGDLLQAARRHVQAHLVKSDVRGLQFVVCQLFVVVC